MNATKNVTAPFNPPVTSGPAVTLNPNRLASGTGFVGSNSAFARTLTNSGDATLAITSIVASGDYSQANNCASSLASGRRELHHHRHVCSRNLWPKEWVGDSY
jgi:hypothetical protein